MKLSLENLVIDKLAFNHNPHMYIYTIVYLMYIFNSKSNYKLVLMCHIENVAKNTPEVGHFK